jgi:hypothetical protein
MKKLIAVFCLSMVLVLVAVPLPSMATTKTLLPNQFTLATWSIPLAIMESFVRRNFYWLGSVANGGVAYESEIILPVGRRITNVAVNAQAVQPVEVWLGRAKLGDPEETVATFQVSGDRGWYETSNINFAKVASGYRYWIHLDISGSDAFVYGVKITYR